MQLCMYVGVHNYLCSASWPVSSTVTLPTASTTATEESESGAANSLWLPRQKGIRGTALNIHTFGNTQQNSTTPIIPIHGNIPVQVQHSMKYSVCGSEQEVLGTTPVAAGAHFWRWMVENECLTRSTTCTTPSPVEEAQGTITCDWSGTNVGAVEAWPMRLAMLVE